MANKKKTTKAKATVLQGAVPTTIDPNSVQGFKDFQKASEELRSKGYTALPSFLGSGDKGGISYGMDDYISSQLSCDCKDSNRTFRGLPLLHVSSGIAIPYKTQDGHEGEYIEWGWGNKLPNVVAMLTGISPYVAAGHKFNTDLCAGMGPQPMYSYTQYVGGNITHKEINFEDAGVLLQGMIRDLQLQLLKLEEEHPELKDSAQGDSPSVLPLTLPQQQGQSTSAQTAAAQLHADIKEQIQALRERYQLWQQVDREVRQFIKDNNLEQTNLHLNVDMHLLGLCFPEIGLSKYTIGANGKADTRSLWKPKATKLTYRSSFICRLEKLSLQNKIEYVSMSNQWLDQPYTTPDPTSITALPALSADEPENDLERITRNARTARLEPEARPTRIIFPVSYPTAGRPYYPVLAWHSIFGDVYIYLMTIVGDRKRRRDNANVIGRVIYLSDEYLSRLYVQRECTTNDQKKKLFNEVVSDINTFLKNRDNMGEPLVAYNFTGADGKIYKSWEIVEIEANSKNTVEANKEELAEISSIVFFAMGLDSQLVGNSPGTTVRSGGTDLRERYLLKQIQMSPTQQLMLKPLEVISQFNGWDKAGLVWRIKREVLTTLDNSKTGITNAETE